MPYKGRIIDTTFPIKVYRNLNKKGVWYSIRQRGLTIAHASALCVIDAVFIVNQKQRERILKNKKKEFHAYIQGTFRPYVKPIDLPAEIKYNPFIYQYFTCINLDNSPFHVSGAKSVVCNENGVSAIDLIKNV